MTKKVQVTLPDRIATELEAWAEYDGRPLANLCAYLLERAISDSKEKGADWFQDLKAREQRIKEKGQGKAEGRSL
ncbi:MULTISPECIES: ribbon-helix-helix domain-containing protein [Cyanophyceae]|uniref:CopG-like ribbon-helix-helix domain-containing protein n=1 Tax=Stenomitos frigidus AS-A4 TaxID=2933935 RepID=A0ABV0KVC6_9CYAN|nr:hypothetical protein [Phormidium sp. FACHB-592]